MLMTVKYLTRYKLIALFFCSLMLFTSCRFYHLAERSNRPELTQRLVNKKKNVAVVIHEGEIAYQLENPKVDSGMLSGTLKAVDEPIDFYYQRLQNKANLNVKKMDLPYIRQVHFFVNNIPDQDSTNLRINTSEIELTKEIRLNLKLTMLSNIVPETLIGSIGILMLLLLWDILA
jgi:hypothetical protein